MKYKDPNKQKEDRKDYMKAYKKAHKEKISAYYEAHKEEIKAYYKSWKEAHKERCNTYAKSYISNDLNSLGKTKNSIRQKSQYYLIKYGQKIEGYEIHHCCTYNEPYKFIYCSKEMHRLIHAYLKKHNIDADTEHYDYIKHLLDDTVIKYNVD